MTGHDDPPPGTTTVGERLLQGDDSAALAELLARAPGVLPEWDPAPGGRWDAARGPGVALSRVAARFLQVLGERFGRAVEKRELAFLGLAGVRLVPPRSSRAPVAFRLQDKSPNTRVPAGTKLTAAAAGGAQPASFETEEAVAVSSAKLVEVFSFWPGRDQYIDHSADHAAGRPFHPFRKADLVDTPHAMYIAHDGLLALSGKVTLRVGVEFLTPGSPALSLVWEYWDGKVWRAFKDPGAACSRAAGPSKDGTQGFTRNGPIVLETDFAETGPVAVRGVTSHWIRARLDIPLPAGGSQFLSARPGRDSPAQIVEGARILPEIDVVDLAIEIQRPLPARPSAKSARARPRAADPDPDPTQPDPIGGKIVPDLGLPLEKAFADRLPLDVSKTFSPFGPQPQPGSAFYWMIDEAMGKPGAIVTVELTPAFSPQHLAIENLQVDDPRADPAVPVIFRRERKILDPTLAWEYWDGRAWSPLPIVTDDPLIDPAMGWASFLPPYRGAGSDGKPLAAGSRRLKFRVPTDVGATKVNAVEGRWVRVRLVSGAFGVTYTVTATRTQESNSSFILDPPALVDFRVGYLWQYGPFPPERVLTYNDFRHADVTDKALWEGNTFAPFHPPGDTTPALYLGFDASPPEDRIGTYFDVEEDPLEDQGPPLAWEYWDGFAWKELPSVDDRTRHLRVPGLANVLGPADSAELDRFGTPRHWVRARLREDGPPGEPTLNAITPNAVDCVQRETIVGEPLGLGDGGPNLMLAFRRVPVQEGETVEVRESSGARAEVEWRLIAREVSGGDERVIRDLESKLAAEGAAPDPESGRVRLKRDRLKRVTEVWVVWRGRPHLLDSGPADRDYAVERSRGEIRFGDGTRGKVPPPGSAIQAKRYQTGGGAAGNVAKGAITSVAGAIPGLEKVENLRAAQGGADGETVAQARARGPETIRNRGRALLPGDYEALALEASPSIARAWAMAERDPAGRSSPRAGGVTLQILPRTDPGDPLPWPSFGLREEVRKFLSARAPASVFAGDRIRVTGPRYFPVDIEATLAPIHPDGAGTMLDLVKTALATFLHPVFGGPEGKGWAPERPLFASEVATVLEGVAGLDHVEGLTLLVDGSAGGDRVAPRAGRIIAAGKFLLKLAPAAIPEGRP